MSSPRSAPSEIQWAAALLNEPVSEWTVVYSRQGRSTMRLHSGPRIFYLKAASGLSAENDRFRWLSSFRPTPEVLGYRPGDPDWLLTTAAIGADLTDDKYTRQPEILVRLLAEALTGLHKIDPSTCPFGEPAPGQVVVHGDACLPNFLATDNRISGYIDVGDLRIGRPEIDLAAAVWSLHHNLGHGWGASFLRAYGWTQYDEDTVERLRPSY